MKKVNNNKISREDAINAVNVLLQYIGEDINREGILDTAERVIKSYDELFVGYKTDVEKILSKQFCEVGNYEDMIFLKSIQFSSLCEHHMLPFHGTVDVAYVPNNSVVGLSKIARLVEVFARRLQIQERMTTDIADAMHQSLKPHGVAVRISAEHSCMFMRGVDKQGSIMTTQHFTGIFKRQENKDNFLRAVV